MGNGRMRRVGTIGPPCGGQGRHASSPVGADQRVCPGPAADVGHGQVLSRGHDKVGIDPLDSRRGGIVRWIGTLGTP